MAAIRSMRLIALGAMLAALLAPSVSFAQSNAPAASAPIPPPAAAPAPSTGAPPAAGATPAVAQPSPPPLSPETERAVDRRIDALKTALAITAAQASLWDTFAHAMRENAQSTDALFAQRADAVASMSAVDNMHNYARIARAYADNTERLAAAFDNLYASLSERQKHTADTVFRQQAEAAANPHH